MKKSFFIFVVFCIQCAFGITLEEIANKKFWEVDKFSNPKDPNFILAKPQGIKEGTLVVEVFLNRVPPPLEPNMFEINTEDKVATDIFYANTPLKIKFELNHFSQDGDKLILDNGKGTHWTFRWLDKKKRLLLRSASGVDRTYIDIEYLLENNLPIPPIVVYDMRDL